MLSSSRYCLHVSSHIGELVTVDNHRSSKSFFSQSQAGAKDTQGKRTSDKWAASTAEGYNEKFSATTTTTTTIQVWRYMPTDTRMPRSHDHPSKDLINIWSQLSHLLQLLSSLPMIWWRLRRCELAILSRTCWPVGQDRGSQSEADLSWVALHDLQLQLRAHTTSSMSCARGFRHRHFLERTWRLVSHRTVSEAIFLDNIHTLLFSGSNRLKVSG